MRVVVDGREFVGPAVDLRDVAVSPAAVRRAVDGDGGSVSVDCAEPGPVHEYVGYVAPGTPVPGQAALAAAARSRGRTAPQDDQLHELGDALDALDVSNPDLEDARRRVADASGREEELRERVAMLRGRVRALRDAGLDPSEARAALEDASRRLATVETERIAARQTLARLRSELRRSRDRRQRRLRLQDREANLRRAARAHLAAEMREPVADAREAVTAVVSGAPDAVVETLAVARVADVAAPIVVDGVDVGPPVRVADCCDAPVIHL